MGDDAESAGLERLDHALRLATGLVPELLHSVMHSVATRVCLSGRKAGLARIDALAAAGAWTDATLYLLELELPTWTVRRLVREGNEWLRTLSRQPNLPIALDDAVETLHAVLPLAILRALVEARRRLGMEPRSALLVPRIPLSAGIMVCCDNFV